MAKLCRRVCTVTGLVRSARRAATAGLLQCGDADRRARLPAGKQPLARPRQPPVGAQDLQQLWRQHDIAVLAALALLDPDQHPVAVDGANREACDFADAQARAVGRRQRRPVAQAWHRLQKPHDLVGAQHHRQLLRLAGGNDVFKSIAPAQGDAVEEPQRAHGLIDVRPRPLLRNQMELVGPHLLKAKPVRRTAEMPAELGDGIEVGLLRRRRQIADHHVVDHASAQRADLSHRKLLSDEVVQQTNPLRQEPPASAAPYRGAVSFNR